MQITLNESEMKEAIRNYIRAQVPVIPDDELPVKIVAGRGENGHSAEVTLSVMEYAVSSPSRPTAPMATFTAVVETALRRNSEENENITADTNTENVAVFEEASDIIAFEAPKPKEDPSAKSQKKSSLFDNMVVKAESDTVAAEAAAAPPEAEISKSVQEPIKIISASKPKSIFDA